MNQNLEEQLNTVGNTAEGNNAGGAAVPVATREPSINSTLSLIDGENAVITIEYIEKYIMDNINKLHEEIFFDTLKRLIQEIVKLENFVGDFIGVIFLIMTMKRVNKIIEFFEFLFNEIKIDPSIILFIKNTGLITTIPEHVYRFCLIQVKLLSKKFKEDETLKEFILNLSPIIFTVLLKNFELMEYLLFKELEILEEIYQEYPHHIDSLVKVRNKIFGSYIAFKEFGAVQCNFNPGAREYGQYFGPFYLSHNTVTKTYSFNALLRSLYHLIYNFKGNTYSFNPIYINFMNGDKIMLVRLIFETNRENIKELKNLNNLVLNNLFYSLREGEEAYEYHIIYKDKKTHLRLNVIDLETQTYDTSISRANGKLSMIYLRYEFNLYGPAYLVANFINKIPKKAKRSISRRMGNSFRSLFRRTKKKSASKTEDTQALLEEMHNNRMEDRDNQEANKGGPILSAKEIHDRLTNLEKRPEPAINPIALERPVPNAPPTREQFVSPALLPAGEQYLEHPVPSGPPPMRREYKGQVLQEYSPPQDYGSHVIPSAPRPMKQELGMVEPYGATELPAQVAERTNSRNTSKLLGEYEEVKHENIPEPEYREVQVAERTNSRNTNELVAEYEGVEHGNIPEPEYRVVEGNNDVNLNAYYNLEERFRRIQGLNYNQVQLNETLNNRHLAQLNQTLDNRHLAELNQTLDNRHLPQLNETLNNPHSAQLNERLNNRHLVQLNETLNNSRRNLHNLRNTSLLGDLESIRNNLTSLNTGNTGTLSVQEEEEYNELKNSVVALNKKANEKQNMNADNETNQPENAEEVLEQMPNIPLAAQLNNMPTVPQQPLLRQNRQANLNRTLLEEV